MATGTTPEQIYSIEELKGVDLLEDSRRDPGSFARLTNLYGRTSTTLAKRPGSTLVCNGQAGSAKLIKPSGIWDDGKITTNLTLGQRSTSLVNTSTTGVRASFDGLENVQIAGPYFRPLIGGGAIIEPVNFPANLGPTRVSALTRCYFDLFGARAYLIGVFNYQAPYPDQVFYYEPTTDQLKIVPTPPGAWSTHGADCQIIKYRYKDSSTGTQVQSYHGIITNGVNQPLTLQDGVALAYTPGGVSINVATAVLGAQPSNTAVFGSAFYLCGVRAMCVYQNQIVYAGFNFSDGTTLKKFQERACFSDAGTPHIIASNSGAVGDIIIGEGEYEPLVAVDVNTVAADTGGTNGTLVFFTGRKITVFQGSPATTGNPVAADFSSVLSRDFGCYAPKTITRTPFGLTFLGSDGVVYVMPLTGGIAAISRKIDPAFRNMTPKAQAQCSAFYWRGFYCISAPGGLSNRFGIGATAFTPTPSQQWWADMRGYDPKAPGMGIKWSGPHTGMIDNCYAKADGYEDTYDIYSGSAIDGTIYKRMVETSYTDPNPLAPNTPVTIAGWATMNLQDGGNIHIDKTVTAVSYVGSTDVSTTINVTLAVIGQTSGSGDGEQWSNVFAPQGSIFDVATFDNGLFDGDSATDIYVNQTSEKRRGRAWTVDLQEVPPATGAALIISDIQFRVIVASKYPRTGE